MVVSFTLLGTQLSPASATSIGMGALAALLFVLPVSVVLAAPPFIGRATRTTLVPRAVTTLSANQLNAYSPYTEVGRSFLRVFFRLGS
jgi:hypothetical protein